MSPASASFGPVLVGSTVSQPIMIRNIGGPNSSNIAVSNVSISGAGFTVSGISTGQILAPGQSVTVDVTFSPATPASTTGSITLMSDAANSPGVIPLSGTGVPPAPHPVILAWTPEASPVASYNVHRSSISGGPYTKLNSSAVTAPAYTDVNVQSGKTYYYVVTSINLTGVESFNSSEVSANIP